MTLTTTIYFPSSFSAENIFHQVRGLLNANSDMSIVYENNYPRHKPGMGLDAWIITCPVLDIHGLQEVVDLLEERPYFSLIMNTVYSYDKNGYKCGDLHAGIILQLCILNNTYQFVWEHDTTGERFKGANEKELKELGNPFCFSIWETLFNY